MRLQQLRYRFVYTFFSTKTVFVSDEKNIRVLMLTTLAEVIGFGILIPIVPLMFVEPTSQFFILPESYSIGVGYILLGLLVGAYPLMQFLATPILGELSDIYGRKSVIQISIFGTVISTLIFTYALATANLLVLFLSRIVNGLTGGLNSVVQASIADISNEENKSKNLGKIGATFGAGFVIGPFLGGLLSSGLFWFTGLITPFLFAAALSFGSLLFVSRHLKETSPMKKGSINWLKPFTQLKKGLQMENLKKLFAANFFYFSGFAFFTTFLSVILVERFSFTQLDIGNTFLLIGLVIMFTQLVLIPRLFPRFSEEDLMPITLMLTGLAVLAMGVQSDLVLFLLFASMFAMMNGITNISLETLVSRNASEDDQGLALGTNQSLRSLANAGPSMLSGVAAALFTSATPIYLAGGIILLTGLIYFLTERP